MSFDIKRQRIVARRMVVFGGLKVTLFSAFTIKIASLQLFKDGMYKKLSEDNHTRKTMIIPKRGIIFDRNGEIIATSKKYYRLIFSPSTKKEKDVKQISNLAYILGLDESGEKQMVKRYKTAKGVPFVINKYLSRRDLIKINTNLVYLPSVYIEEAFLRTYRDPFAYSSIIGYISESDKESDDLIKSSDIKVGKSGIEKHYNQSLLGIPGIKATEIDSKARIVGTYNIKEAIDGTDLKLSLDAKVQDFTYNIIKDKTASVAVIHIPTNSVLTCISTPSFNANSLSKQITSAEWGELNQNPYKPLLNRVFSALYPPGSIFKVPVCLAALDQGINPHKEEYCPGYFYYGNRKFNCWKKEGHGKVNMFTAIKQSCNVYFYKTIKDMDIEASATLIKHLGLGCSPYDEILATLNYERGLIGSPKWKKRHQRDLWQGGDSINFGIGQGFNLVNCFQLAVMMARIASGKVIEPKFTFGKEDVLSSLKDLVINPEHLDIVKQGMFRATNEAGGTSFLSKLGVKDFEMSGKTGSAQTVSRFIEKNEKREEFENTHGLYVGFAPFNNPQYSIAVINEHGGFGAAAAAPLAKQIMQFVYKTYHEVVEVK